MCGNLSFMYQLAVGEIHSIDTLVAVTSHLKMKFPVSFAASRQHLRVIEEAIAQQQAFIRHFGENDEFRLIGERVLLGLEATIVMMRAQHLLVLENTVDQTTDSDKAVQ